MTTKNFADPTANVADQAVGKADQAIRSTQRVTNDALDGLSDSVNSAGARIAPLLNRATEQASAYAQRG
ncbi:MAG: hypothetical protein ABW190_03090, partial [Rhizobacter sp.]